MCALTRSAWMVLLLTAGCALSAAWSAPAAPPSVWTQTWVERYYAASPADDGVGYATAVTPGGVDGGYFLAGRLRRLGPHPLPYLPWVARLDADGQVLWDTQLGTPGSTIADLSYVSAEGRERLVVVGQTAVTGGRAERGDLWLVTLDAEGGTVLENRFPFPNLVDAAATDVEAFLDLTERARFVVVGYAGDRGWAMVLDGDGSPGWQRIYASSAGPVRINAVTVSPDGGFVVAGQARPDAPQTVGEPCFWAAKLDRSGGIEWQTSLGGGNQINWSQEAVDVAPAADGGYVLVGRETGLQPFALMAELAPDGGVVRIRGLSRPLGAIELTGILPTYSGFVVVGDSSQYDNPTHLLVGRVDEDATHIVARLCGDAWTDPAFARMIAGSPEVGFTVAGSAGGDPVLLKTDSEGDIEHCAWTVGKVVITDRSGALSVDRSTLWLKVTNGAVAPVTMGSDLYEGGPTVETVCPQD
jgi:hypothetical protein